MIPRVSEICELFYPGGFYEDLATERGTYYHEFIASALTDPGAVTIADRFALLRQEPFLVPLADWLQKEVTHILQVEEQHCNRLGTFTGRPDAVFATRSIGYIRADWKSGKAETMCHKMQSAAYEMLENDEYTVPFMPCWRFYLGNGKVDMKRTTNPEGYQAAFLAGVKFYEAKAMLRGL